MSSKLDEANELISKAEKCLKTSFLKRKPDYDSAVEYYSKAAVIYRNSKQLDKAAEIYKTVAELYFKMGSYFHCAKQYEAASQMYRDLKNYEQMACLVTEAGKLLRQNGTPDSASYVYERAAKSLEPHLPERAAEFYEKSADACETEEKYNEASSQVNHAARIMVRMKNFSEAERLLRLYINYVQKSNVDTVAATVGGFSDPNSVPKLCGRAVTALILIKLYQEDEIAVNKIFNEAIERWRFCEAEEFHPVRRLLQSVEEMDKEACMKAINDPCFRMLDLDYARLAKEIKFPYTEQIQNQSESKFKETPFNDSQTSDISTIHQSNSQKFHEQYDDTKETHQDNEDEEDIC